jgi:hypothetical protein
MCGDLTPSAACVQMAERAASAACETATASAYCDVRCSADQDCSGLTASHYCSNGFCRTHASTNVTSGSGGHAGATARTAGAAGVGGTAAGAAGAAGAASAAGTAGAAGAAGSSFACTPSGVNGNEILVLGDLFIATNHQITAYLEDRAREAGTLQSGERFRDYSTFTNNSLALAGEHIADQYSKGQSEGTSKVVILCGGGSDVLGGYCASPPTSDCQSLVAAAAAANDLLAQMATDGIQDVVWFFYPDPTDTALAAKLDVLRPMVQSACENSSVPCHWVDLRDTFSGHYSEYLSSDGKSPTAAGSQATADTIWAVMQQACIAQ